MEQSKNIPASRETFSVSVALEITSSMSNVAAMKVDVPIGADSQQDKRTGKGSLVSCINSVNTIQCIVLSAQARQEA